MRIALLGSGFVADLYMRALERVPQARVVVNYSGTLARARSFSRRWRIPSPTDSLRRAVEHPDVDLALILLPNFLHKEAALALARAGKAMVCEKPLARSVAEAEAMLEAAEKAGVFHGYAESEVFAPAVERARELVEGGAIGRVISFRGYGAHGGPHASWFWDKAAAGGGALLDMGCHSIESARLFFGKKNRVREVMAWGATLVHKTKTRSEDGAALLLRFESGGLAQISVSWTARGGLDVRGEVHGTEGAVHLDLVRGSPVRAFTLKGAYGGEKAELDRGWLLSVPDEPAAFGYENELRHFVACSAAGKRPRETFADGLAVQRVIAAAYRSMRTKRWERP